MSAETTVSVSQFLWFLGAIITISTVYSMWHKVVKKRDKEEEAIEELKASNQVILKTLLTLINHSIDGNGIEGMKAIRSDIQDYLADKAVK